MNKKIYEYDTFLALTKCDHVFYDLVKFDLLENDRNMIDLGDKLLVFVKNCQWEMFGVDFDQLQKSPHLEVSC